MALGFCPLKMLTVFHFRLTAETWGVQMMSKTKHCLGRWRETAWTCAPSVLVTLFALWVRDGSLLSTTSSQFSPACTIFWQPVTKNQQGSGDVLNCWGRGDRRCAKTPESSVFSHLFSESLHLEIKLWHWVVKSCSLSARFYPWMLPEAPSPSCGAFLTLLVIKEDFFVL